MRTHLPTSPLLSRVLLALAGASLVYGAFLWWPRTVDDAYITFRYARNLVDGFGPNFNPGERVEGYSSPSWLAFMACAVAAGMDPVPASKGCGLAFSVILLAVVYWSLRRAGVVGWGAAAATLLLGSSAVLQMWSVAGMETNAYALFFFTGLAVLALGRPGPPAALLASVALAAAALTRPEGAAFWGAGLIFILASRPEPTRGETATRLQNGVAYALPGLLLILHFLWRIYYYGAPAPNTYYVKTGGGSEMWRQGLYGLSLFARNPAHLVWIIAAVAGAVWSANRSGQGRRVGILSGAALLHLLYVVSVGDDGLRIHRFYVPVLPILAFLAALPFAPSRAAGRAGASMRGAGALAVALGVLLSIRTLRAEVSSMRAGSLVYQEGNEKLGRFLGAYLRPDTLIAVSAAGAIPYYSGLAAIDMYGLNDPHIARRPFPAGHRARLMKWDNGYVLSRRPDLIVINRGYFRAGDPLSEQVPRDPRVLAASPMDRDLLEKVAKDGSYALRAIRFPDGSVFYVFERTRAREMAK